MNNRKTTSKLRRLALILAGNFFVALGIIGIFLPLLPTTPFLLLAAACYFRSSEKFYYWLMNNRWMGNYVKNYREKKKLPLKVKVLSLSFLWLTIGYSVFFVVNIFLLRVILVLIAIGVTIHILSIRNLKQWSSVLFFTAFACLRNGDWRHCWIQIQSDSSIQPQRNIGNPKPAPSAAAEFLREWPLLWEEPIDRERPNNFLQHPVKVLYRSAGIIHQRQPTCSFWNHGKNGNLPMKIPQFPRVHSVPE